MVLRPEDAKTKDIAGPNLVQTGRSGKVLPPNSNTYPSINSSIKMHCSHLKEPHGIGATTFRCLCKCKVLETLPSELFSVLARFAHGSLHVIVFEITKALVPVCPDCPQGTAHYSSSSRLLVASISHFACIIEQFTIFWSKFNIMVPTLSMILLSP
ncbi:hypothetical protein V6N13_020815 [Hibiscus sabdariffa]